MRPTLLLALTCVALALSACDGSPGESPATPGPTATSSPTRTPGATTAATWASIGQLDPCKLGAAGREDEIEHLPQPFDAATRCSTSGSGRSDEIEVRVGEPWAGTDLRGLTRTPVAGRETWVGPRGRTCFALLPAGGASVTFTAQDGDCASLVEHVTTVITTLAADPHAYDLDTPRPVACQLLSSAGLVATGGRIPACSAGEVTVWLLDGPLTYPDDTPLMLGSVRAIRSERRLADTQSLEKCSVRWTVASRIEAAVLAPTCERAVAVARKAAAGRWTPPEPGALAITPAD